MARPFRVAFALLALVLGVALLASADEARERRLLLRAAEEPLRARDWKAAVTSLRAFRERHGGTPEAEEAWALEARALLLSGAAREVLDTTSAFLAAHGESAWAGRMKSVAAEAHAALRMPKESADGLRERVEAVTSAEARAAIGALHVELADRDFDGVDTTDDLGRTTKVRNVARALESYGHALQVGVAAADLLRVRERVALALEETGQHPAAAEAWHALLTERPEAPADLRERWLVGRGRARLRSGRLDEAREDLRAAIERFPRGKERMETLLLLGEERLAAAQGAAGDGAFEEGVAWIRRAIGEHRDDPRASRAQRALAEAYEGRGQSEKAATEWGAFVDRFPKDEQAPEARDRQARALAQAGLYDQAIAAWERFLAAWPNHPLWQSVRQQVVDAAFAKGAARKAANDPAGAVAAWRAFADQHPGDPRGALALLEAGRTLREQGEAEVAIELWRQVTGRYATTGHAPAALFAVAVTLEDDLARLEDAVKTYEEVLRAHGGSGEAGQARARLERLKGKHLEIRMERVQSPGRPAALKTITRNIEGLDVRLYRLDLEEYFRRKGTVAGVENLQLEVVKPDQTTRMDIGGYRPFALIEADRDLPVNEPGAYVVVAGQEDLTATVLLLVSDLEIVTKQARGRQLFVWAFAREGQAPVAGARVLARHGNVVEVGTTGPDGVWQGSAGHGSPHVLVVSEKGMAATEIVPNVEGSTGFVSKAYVHTDRPVYRPGHEVAWRAVFLRADGGAYLPPEKTVGRVSVRDARGQLVFEEDATSSDFGTFSGKLPIDGAAPLGTWTLQLEVKHRGSWTGTFEVQEFRKPEFTLTLEPKRPVYLTGETVTAVARLRYAFGGFVADAPVRYEVRRVEKVFAPTVAEDYSWYVRDQRVEEDEATPPPTGTVVTRGEARTDVRGEVTITFETAEKDADAEYVVDVATQDVTRRWIADQGRIPVTRRDHMAVVKTDLKVYRPRQEARVEVRTVDAREAPVARGGAVHLYELRRGATPPAPPDRRHPSPSPAPGEEEVERAVYPLTTNAAGAAELRVPVPGPGRWRFRWKATDARGNLVTAYADVDAAGEAEDPSKDARLVPARSVYVEGEAAEVLLQSPVTGVTALLTYEGEQVLEHRFVQLTGASTLLSLPLAAGHAPNVHFKVAIPGDGRLLEAAAEVVVVRHLAVTVTLPATARPGEEVAVTVKTTDAQGKPTPAELGVALVDETVYAVAPDRAGAITPYFYDRRRVNSVVTASSLGFRTYGTTRETNQDLLDDEAIRSGDGRRVAALSALREAREALRRGDREAAVDLARKAAEADPQSWDARVLMDELGAFEASKEALAEASDRERAEHRAGERPGSTRPAPSPSAPALEPAADGLAPAEMEAGEVPPGIAMGGGAGGAFGGRRGGGGRQQQQSPPRIVGYLADKDEKSFGDLPALGGAFGLDLGQDLGLRQKFADTAAWDPHVVTGTDGTATVKVTLPDNLTTWRAVARGVSRTALVGEGRARLVARKDLLVRVDAPRFLTQGDRVVVPVAVHNETDAERDVEVSVTASGVEGAGAAETLRLAPHGRGVSDRDLSALNPGAVRVEAQAVAAGAGDRTEARLGTLPRGIRVLDGRSGTVSTDRADLQETFLDVPEGAVPGATKVAVVLYPGIDAAVLDALLYLDLFPYGCIEQTVHRFGPALEARAALLAAGSPEAARLKALDEAARRGAERLRNLQNQDGSFGWFGGGQGDLAMTAYALIGLAGAREAGVKGLDDAVARATGALLNLVKAGTEDARALGHLALARVGTMEPEAYASTFRRRSDDLSVAGLSWMAMASHRLDRAYEKDELVRLLLARRVEKDGLTSWTGPAGDCFVGSAREATGLAVQALLVTRTATPHAERGLRWLLETRAASGFGSTKDTAAFVGAAAAWVRENGAQAFGGTIEVLLDGTRVRTVRTGGREGLDPKDRRFVIEGTESLAPGRHRLGFRLEGQGRVDWAARLESVVASEDLPADTNGVTVARDFLVPEEAPVEGQPPPVKPGFSILRESSRPRVEARTVERVGIGDKVLVRVKVTAPRELQYVLVEDPLPAGFEVLEGTAAGPFDWQERRDDRQVFFLGRVPQGATTLEYVLQATHWGAFTALGTTAHAMYLPEVHGRAAGHRIEVVRGPRETDVETPPTPDELYGRAVRLFEAKDYEGAGRALSELRDTLPIRDEIVEEIEAMLLRGAIERKDARETVRAREALVRRNGGRIPGDWDSQRSIAFAYQEIGELEPAAGLFRDLLARGFGLEVDWARTLAARGREVEGLDRLGTALARFPVMNATASVAFQRAQRYRELPRPSGRGRPEKEPMDEETLDALHDFTAHFADHRLADPAHYAIVEALRRSGDLDGAAGAAERFLARFPGSVFEDDTWYFLAESRFAAFEKEPTAARAAPVEEAAKPLTSRKFPRREGEAQTESEFRARAWHLLARIQHVLGDLRRAVELYRRAWDVEDAREAHAFLTEVRLRLKPTVVVGLGDPARFPIEYRNVKEVLCKAYPVDLQVLFAVRRSLTALHDVDLSGILPTHEWTVPFPDGQDHRGHEGHVDLPVQGQAPGAWLVVAKAGDHEAKTLVVRTDLSVVLQHVGEKLRVYVTDAAGANVRGAYVTVSDGTRIRARGFTDGRGLFEAPGVGATAAVVVSAGDRYALAP
jgi:uncharacterized protein YfaS (alpha-2-macroglobulin family)